MANRKGGKLWSPGTLKSRGWTKELMAQLLPRPRYRHWNGRSVPCWRQEDVQAAEATEVFQKKARGTAPKGQALQAAQKAAQAGAALLEQAWQAVSHPEGEVGTLAGYYHRAMVDHLPAAARGRGLRSSQVTGFLRQFLALETRCDGAQLPGDLTHFVQAAVWMGANPKAPLTVQVLDRYPQVLWGAAEQAMEAFAQAQPEADGAAFLGRKDFPVQQLLSRTLGTVYSVWYVPQAIRTSLTALLALNPKDEYPEARAMARHFVLHLGGTNTGKTYAGFQRLQQAATGVYLAPLRLLALEAQEVQPHHRRGGGLPGGGHPHGRHGGETEPEAALRGGGHRRVPDDRRPPAGLCLDPGHPGGPGAGGPPVRRARGQGPAGAPHRKLRGQL